MPSEEFEAAPGSASLAKTVAQITKHVVSEDGTMSLDGTSLMRLKDRADRDAVLRELVGAICPPTPFMDAWKLWLAGGADPTEFTLPRRPGSTQRASKQVFDRSDRARAAARKKCDEAEQKIAAAKEELALAIREAEFAEAHQKAELHWYISDALSAMMRSTFALGPAWTVMRCLSSFMTDEELKSAAAFALSATHAEEEKRDAMKHKSDMTSLMLKVLDQYCGHPGFEAELRSAIEAVVVRYHEKEDGPDGPIYRRRGMETLRTTIQQAGQKHREKILDGLDFE